MVMKGRSWSVNPDTGIYSFNLRDGQLAGMISDPSRGSQSFQRLIKHCVPRRSTRTVQGYRINCTFRVQEDAPVNNLLLPLDEDKTNDRGETGETVMIVKPHCAVKLWSGILTRGENTVLHLELKRQLEEHGRPDTTLVFGRTHANRGRRVLELAHTAGQTYTYGGKTTPPGVPFGEAARLVIRNKIAPRLGVAPDKIWAHVVYYPSADTSLGWHGDAEKGINPHAVLSLTFLENPAAGVRPFQVRRNNYGRIKKLRAKMGETQKRGMEPAMSDDEIGDLERGMPDSPPRPTKRVRRASIGEMDKYLKRKQ